MELNSWGNFPKIKKKIHQFSTEDALQDILNLDNEMICYGNGRSYGDSALNDDIIYVRPCRYFLDFNEQAGILHCQAGVLLAEIIESFLPRGFFLKVTPGTKFITIGGAIAADVHGKNHHLSGCFSESLVEFRLMLANGSIVTCSAVENVELYRATCGGMGLTGVILDAKIQLMKVASAYIEQRTVQTRNLEETFAAFEQYADSTYSVAWIDCLAKGDSLGRSILMLGEHAERGALNIRSSTKLSIPFYPPSFLLNKISVMAFNEFYYRKAENNCIQETLSLDTFFYPLDSILNWNRLYGKNGFTQYQFVLPLNTAREGLTEILKHISQAGKGSFLSVLKRLGKENQNYLSFPMEGYTLALDFKLDPELFQLFEQLDKIVSEHNGRIYLAKDVRVSKAMFETGYPAIDKFRELRADYQLNEKFNSLQSIRTGL